MISLINRTTVSGHQGEEVVLAVRPRQVVLARAPLQVHAGEHDGRGPLQDHLQPLQRRAQGHYENVGCSTLIMEKSNVSLSLPTVIHGVP